MSESDRGPWRVLLALSPDELDALQPALPEALGDMQWGLAVEALPDGGEGDPLLWMDVRARTQESALHGATSC